jgi:hypothetical protein
MERRENGSTREERTGNPNPREEEVGSSGRGRKRGG